MRFMQTELVLQTKNRSGPAKNRFSVALHQILSLNLFHCHMCFLSLILGSYLFLYIWEKNVTFFIVFWKIYTKFSDLFTILIGTH